MKTQFKTTLQFLLIATIVFSFFPFRSVANASVSPKANIPVDFQITQSASDGLELLLSAPSYQTKEIDIEGETYDQIEVLGANTSSEFGQIQLPIANTLIGVPPQADITLEIVEDAARQIPGSYHLARAPLPALIEDINSTERWDYSQQNFMSEDSFGNSFVVARIAEEAWIRDQRVVRIEYQPFEFDISSGVLTWHSAVKVRIHFNYPLGIPIEPSVAKYSQSESPFEGMLETSILNYEQAKIWRDMPVSSGIQTTPPDSGPRYRIAITEDGIYKLTYQDLKTANPSLASLDLSLLQMTSQGKDIAIYVEDENANNIFDSGDYIIFYGQRFYGDQLADLYQNENNWWRTFIRQQPDGSYTLWKPELNALMLEKYTRENVYWLFEGSSNGLRMQTVDGDPSSNSNAPVEHYRKAVRAEESNWWKTTLFAGEESWFWEIISFGAKHPFTTSITAPASTGPNAILRSEFVSVNHDPSDGFDHHTQIYFNDNPTPISNFYWSGKSRYSYEHKNISAGSILDGINTFYIECLTDAQVSLPSYYFDWFEIEYNRLFVAENNAIEFTSTVTGTQKYQVSGFTDVSNPVVLDISNTNEPVRVLNSANQTEEVEISLTHPDAISIAMATGNIALLQDQISYYVPPNWSTMDAGFDYVYITHSDFLTSTTDLANYRNGTGLSTAVIDINDLYNEFNFGIYHPIAIKNFLAFAFANWTTKPTYTLLVGDGHWNFYDDNLAYYGSGQQFMPPHLVWVDPWQGEVDSANLLATIVGDDAFPDLMIARLPVNSEAEIDTYRSKLESYEAPHTPEAWEQNHGFVADLADDAGNFPALADDIITEYIDPTLFATPVRIYEEDYGCVNNNPCPAVNAAISDTLNITGTLILNYIGHASVQRWSHEAIFTPSDFSNLTNTDQLPVIISMDCLDGYWNGPSEFPGTSMIEEIVRQSNSGAIGSFSPTGLGVSTGHDLLHKGFYDALMNEGLWELGAAAQNAKLWLFTTGQNQDLIHTFTVFGDPALEIRNPFGLSVTPNPSTKHTDLPGSIVTHTIIIQNTGFVSDTYEIEITSNWGASLPYTTTAPILPGGQLSIPVEIQVPNQTAGSDAAILTITSQGNIGESIDVLLNTHLVNSLFEIFLPLLSKGY